MDKKRTLVALAVWGLLLPFTLSVALAATEPDFNGVAQFRDRWVAQDKLVGDPGVNRPFTWGPNIPSAPTNLSEPYVESPGGTRKVLYLDKARMEINDPATGFVTTGLAVKELVSGKRQDGNNTFTQLLPSKTQVAGDPVAVNPNAPVYASFKDVVTLGNADGNSKPNAVGGTITQYIDKAGAVSTIAPPESLTIGAYNAQTGHNIAQVFVQFQNQSGPVTNPSNGSTVQDQPIYTNDPTSNVFGLPVSEPYWVTTKIAGVTQTVLVQLFERRVLTYNPALATNKVEMGNLGQHYYVWRYKESVAAVGNFAGKWDGNFARMALNQSGNSVTGTFQRYDDASIVAIQGTVTSNTLNGYWNNNPGLTLVLNLDAGGNSFSGSFAGNLQWCGVKAGTGPLPAGCGFSGVWNTNFAFVTLSQNGDTATGTYRRYGEATDYALNGKVSGGGSFPELNGYYGDDTKQTILFHIAGNSDSFDGNWETSHQWCGKRQGTGPLWDGCGWSGKWNLGGSGTVANLVQDGPNVSGTYVNTLIGTVTGNVTGDPWTLRGNWSLNGNSGPFKWVAVSQGQKPGKFRGNWNGVSPWCGYRDGTTAPSPCLLAGA